MAASWLRVLVWLWLTAGAAAIVWAVLVEEAIAPGAPNVPARLYRGLVEPLWQMAGACRLFGSRTVLLRPLDWIAAAIAYLAMLALAIAVWPVLLRDQFAIRRPRSAL